MNEQIVSFLKTHHVSTLTTLLLNGNPHAATIHYSFQEDPAMFFFSTSKTTRKCEKLVHDGISKAALVIGESEEEWITFQAEGDVKIISNEDELTRVKQVHFAMHPRAKEFEKDPNTIFLAFTPSWWRYSAFKDIPPTIIASE